MTRHIDSVALVSETSEQKTHDLAEIFWKTNLSKLTTAPIYGLASKVTDNESRLQIHSPFESKDLIEIQKFARTLNGARKGLALAAWSLTLSAHTDAGPLAVAFAVSRTQANTSNQQYLLKVSYSPDSSFHSWIYDVAAIDNSFYSNAFIGYERICSFATEFVPQTMIAFVDGPEPLMSQAQPPITISVDPLTWNISASYESSLPRGKIRILLDHMKSAMLQIATNPTATIDDLDLVSSSEKDVLLRFGGSTLPPEQGLIHELVEQQAKLTPDAQAVQFESDVAITYRELNERANSVARQLICGRGSYVAVCIPRSVNLVVAMLAILKTGAAYVLLAEDAPLKRNLFIVDDVRAPFTITDKTTCGNFPKEIVIDDLIAIVDNFSRTNLKIYQSPSDIAYIIYTSGTTGVPKGVLLEHQAAYTGLCALPEQDNIRQLLCHSPVFSAAQRSMFGTLKRGGTLCLASKENITVHIQDTIERMRISTLEVTPSMAALIDPSTVSRSVRRITLGGESISPALVQRWASQVELVNAYGLSENTQMNWRRVVKPEGNSRIIGRPTDNTESYVLVPGTTRLSPFLIPGELCLGGFQLAREYLNRPEKTREAFMNNPFGPGRLYRTGDCAICHENGSIEMIGRIDQQTKIDGQRVEPEEANSLICRHPEVVESVTIAATVLNRKALVAVIVSGTGTPWSALWPELRSSLRTQLPPYAVPSYWINRTELPRNVNGKIDLASLVKSIESLDQYELLSLPRNRQMSVTRNKMEDAVMKAVSVKLSIPPMSIDLSASFQDLGGSSLDAIHIVSRLREAAISINVASVLQAGSLKEVAESCKFTTLKQTNSPTPFSLAPSGFNDSEAEDIYPATPLQEGVVADSLLGKANHVYRRLYSIHGVSASQLREAFQSVISRSTLLRTSFTPYKRNFMQIVNKSINLPWKEINMHLEAFLKSAAKDPISLQGSLLRCTVLNESVLVVDIHHAIFDFWSNHFLFEDVNSVLLGQEPKTRASFNNYVRYQEDQLNDRTNAFWEEYLKDANALELQLLKDSHPGKTSSEQAFVVSSRMEADLEGYSAAHGTTAGALIHAAWALLLSIHENADDVLFAAAFSGRDADIDGILTLDGPTLCIVPMRIQLDRSVSVLDFVKGVQAHHLWKLPEYAHYGMRNALKAGGLASDSFNTMVNVLVKTIEKPSPNQPLVPIPVDSQNFTQYITIEMGESVPGFVKLLVPFSANLEAAQSLVDGFAQLLEDVVANPNKVVGQLFEEIQPALSQNRLAETPDGSEIESFYANLAHESFEKIAVTNPTKVALRTKDGEVLTYGDFNAKANSFAMWLHIKGLRPGDMVPLYLEKSISTLIAVFGIMKAGASFTPLDPGNPHDRNSFIIKDVEARLVVTDDKNLETCAKFGIETVVLESLDLSSNTTQPPYVPEMTPESVIYAIYTSGSTGLPKGVLVQHSAVVASTEGMIEATGITASWVALWALNYVFDASYFDVFTILSVGGTLCLAPQDELLSDLTGIINSMEINQVMLTPTITKLISGGSKSVPKLQVLSVCGEKIDTNILEWAASVDVYNGYGPTEATILMTVSKVLPGSSLNSIGFPLKHVTASIYHPDRVEQVLNGSVGELCVSGPQLAKGYLKRPEQTAAAFVRDEEGNALYRTGDLAKWHDDGHLECLGRKDYQVKINGHRIELGEIENAILNTGNVDACVVSVAEMQQKRQLVAFCIFAGETKKAGDAILLPPSQNEKISDISKKLSTLSHYMVPPIWLPFSSFPTLPSGKTDRKKLVALAESMTKAELSTYLQSSESSSEFRLAETETEKAMVKIWATVLDDSEDSIGATSNFASLGGDSISAINIVATSRSFGWSITVNDVLSNPTLSEQAKHLRAAQQEAPVESIIYEIPQSIYDALTEKGISIENEVEDIFPCGPGQVEFLTQGHNTAEQYWQLTVCRSVSEGFDLDLWLEATHELTVRNQILRTTYMKSDAFDSLSWMQIVLKTPSLDWAQIPYATEEEKQHLMEDLREDHFEFGRPAVKYRLLTSTTDKSRTLCIKLHHASYDGTLLRIFDDQFTAFARGDYGIEEPTEFKPFINWNQRSDRNRALAYWKQLLQTYKPISALPTARTHNGGLRFATISGDVNYVATCFGVTPSTVFQAAYSILISRLSGSNDVLFDNLLTGRNAQVDNPQLINGTCANFLPFRSRFDYTGTIKTLMQETQSLFWDTTEHGTVSLGDIYKTLEQDRDTYSARLLFCFQPFEPATGPQGQMRWIVMAMSKVMMNINYTVMMEVQKTLSGYRAKMQYDADILSAKQADLVLELYNEILDTMAAAPDSKIQRLFSWSSSLDRVWQTE